MKKIFGIIGKLTLYIMGAILIAAVVIKLVFTEDVPEGLTGPKADQLAFDMLASINYKEFSKAKELHWTFRGVNQYRWKLQENAVDVYYDDLKVALSTQYPEISFVYKNGKPVTGEERKAAIAYALKNFNNDSFWLVAPFKVMDIGTKRAIITEDGKKKLLVTYTRGGSTPGDSYLWELDQNNRPISFKMWVDIIPLDGIKAKWSNWQMTEGGFPLAQSRSIYGLEIPVSDIKVVK